MTPCLSSFRTTLAQASSFGLSAVPGMIWPRRQDCEIGRDFPDRKEEARPVEHPRNSTGLGE
jgi:hypothetical protein